MKIEIGESLMLSWLKHAKNCQVVQLNWKASTSSWELYNEMELENLMKFSSEYFKDKYNLDIYGQNKSCSQLIQQGEIDALGLELQGQKIQNIYAIDVAFHGDGLNYGPKEETKAKVLKKMIRTAMIIYGYFDLKDGIIIFASPKVNNSVLEGLEKCIEDLNNFMMEQNLNFKFVLHVNDNFREKILQPVISLANSVADTSELFMRSIQMYNLCVDKIKHKKITYNIEEDEIRDKNIKNKDIKNKDINDLDELKIGALVRSSIRRLVSDDKISADIVKYLEKFEYSKNTFHINYAFLKKVDKDKPIIEQRKVNGFYRYWSEIFKIHGEDYFLCQEWYDSNREYFMKWLLNIEK